MKDQQVYWHAEYYVQDDGGSDFVMYNTKEDAQTRADNLNREEYGAYGGWGVACKIPVSPGQEKEAEDIWEKIENP